MLRNLGPVIFFASSFLCSIGFGQMRLASSQVEFDTFKRLMEADGWSTRSELPPAVEIELKPVNGKKACLRKRWVLLNEPAEIVVSAESLLAEITFQTERKDFVKFDGNQLSEQLSDRPATVIYDGKGTQSLKLTFPNSDRNKTVKVILIQSSFDYIVDGQMIQQFYYDGFGFAVFEAKKK